MTTESNLTTPHYPALFVLDEANILAWKEVAVDLRATYLRWEQAESYKDKLDFRHGICNNLTVTKYLQNLEVKDGVPPDRIYAYKAIAYLFFPGTALNREGADYDAVSPTDPFRRELNLDSDSDQPWQQRATMCLLLAEWIDEALTTGELKPLILNLI